MTETMTTRLDIELANRLDRLKKQRKCTREEIEERANLFRKIGQNSAADLLETELIKLAREAG